MTDTAVWTGMVLGVLTSVALGGRKSLTDSMVPVDVLGADSISNGGLAMESLLNATPQFSGGSGGHVNLRNLGENRTLVLTNGRRFTASGGVGYSGSPTFNGAPSAAYGNIQVLGGASGQFGQNAVAGVIGADLKRYDDRVDTAGNDRTTFDLNLAFSATREFSDSVMVESLVHAHYGDHGTIGSGYLKPGLQYNEVFDWSTRTSLSYRFDKQSLGEVGWAYSTYYETQTFKESGSDERDTFRLTIGQEVRKNLNENTTVFATGEYEFSNWDKWGDFDADIFRVDVGVRTGGQDWSTDTSIGWENFNYEDTTGDQDSFFAEMHYYRDLSDRFNLALTARYGVQQVFANEGGSDFVDSTGLLFASRLQFEINSGAALALSFTMLDVESEWTNEDLHRGMIGLDGNFKLTERLTLSPSIVWVNNEDVPSGDDDFTIAQILLRSTF